MDREHYYKNVIHLQSSDVEPNNKIKDINGCGFVVVYAPWCHHCNDLQGTWENLAKANPNSFLAVDSTAHGDLAKYLKVNGYPTILEFKDGVVSGPYKGADRSMGNIQARFADLCR
jgi:hypothetical protein